MLSPPLVGRRSLPQEQVLHQLQPSPGHAGHPCLDPPPRTRDPPLLWHPPGWSRHFLLDLPRVVRRIGRPQYVHGCIMS
jgi:hypothetical protein